MENLNTCIIDDDVQTGELFKEFINRLGGMAQVFQSGQAFFDSAAYKNLCLLVLDLQMPHMDGIEVMRQLVRYQYSSAIILISGFDKSILHSAEQLAQEHNLNVIATLSKPIRFSVLRSVIEQRLPQMQSIPIINAQTEEISLTVDELENAIIDKQFVLHYQPQIALAQNQVVGVEALIRWQHPHLGLIFPNAFIALAEEHGLLGDITAYVVKQSIEQLAQWFQLGVRLNMSINISADNIKSLTLPEQLSRLMEYYQVAPNWVSLEVTESTLIDELSTSLDILTRLRMKGINLSIDDFGTGHSSLTQLYRVPFTELKVDRSFVMKMAQDEDARGIVKMCISLAHELNMQVLAEGVEDAETLKWLRAHGCDMVQGYYFAKPMPANDVLDWITNRWNKN